MNKSTELELMPAKRADDGSLAIVRDEDPIGLFKLAIESKAGADTLERVMAVRRELRAENAQTAFAVAMRNFKRDCPTIIKTKGVSTNAGKLAYKFAPLEEIEAAINPIEDRYHLSHKFNQQIDADAGFVVAECIVKHDLGHSETTFSKLRLGTKTAIMSDTQQDASALTFANRRALMNAYGLVVAGEDIDGQGERPKPPGPSTLRADPAVKPLAQELWDLLKNVRGNLPNWDVANQWLWREEVLDGAMPETAPHLSAARLQTAINRVKEMKP